MKATRRRKDLKRPTTTTTTTTTIKEIKKENHEEIIPENRRKHRQKLGWRLAKLEDVIQSKREKLRNQMNDFHHCVAKEWLKNWEIILLPHFSPSDMIEKNPNENGSTHDDINYSNYSNDSNYSN